jgi:glycosyltransferase involved in cell wall biosynthesis
MHVIDSLHGGGAESSLLEVVPGLRSRGVRTSIVTLLADDGTLDARLHSLGLTRMRLERRNPVGLTLALRDLICSEKPDLIHTTLFFSNLVGRVAARSLRTPIITTLANHDYGPEHRANSRYGAWSVRAAQAVDQLTVPLTTRFHAISVSVAQTMGRRLMIPEDRIQVVYRGRDPARLGVTTPDRRLRMRAALSIDATTPVVLSVGRLDRQKGVDTTIDAFRRLVEHVPDAILLVAGRPGNASAVVRAKAQGCPAVRFLGHRTDVPDLMCAADVLSFPSRWEGLGGTLLEAMALRLPIVASNIPPLVEALGDVRWPLVRPNDAKLLARELVSVLERVPASGASKDAGERRFRHFFTADAASKGMAELYRDVLSNVGAHDPLLPLPLARHADEPDL